MSCDDDKDGISEEIEYDDGQRVVVDSIGVSHFFLPPRRCKNCDD